MEGTQQFPPSPVLEKNMDYSGGLSCSFSRDTFWNETISLSESGNGLRIVGIIIQTPPKAPTKSNPSGNANSELVERDTYFWEI